MKYIKKFENINFDNEWDFEEKPYIIDDFKGHENFYNFLVDNNILDKFLFEFNKDHQKKWRLSAKRSTDLKNYLNNTHYRYFINYSFEWSKTKGRNGFWCWISILWDKECSKNIKKFENINWDNEWDFEDIEEIHIPNDFKGHEDFYNFLVDNNILNKFLYNFNLKSQQRSRHLYGKPNKLKDYLDKIRKYDYIQYTFHWLGKDVIGNYWGAINLKWRKKLSKL